MAGVDVQNIQFIPRGNHTQLSSVNLSVAGAIVAAQDANKILVQAETQNVRYAFSSNVSSVFGFRIAAGDPPTLIPIVTGASLYVIAESGGATLDYQLGV